MALGPHGSPVDVTLDETLADRAFPSGVILAFAGDNIPRGWVFCDGRAYDKTDARYRRLYRAIRERYGSTESTFNVPDLQGRTIIGDGPGLGLTRRTLGEKLGVETVTLTIAQMPAHQHSIKETRPALGGVWVLTRRRLKSSMR